VIHFIDTTDEHTLCGQRVHDVRNAEGPSSVTDEVLDVTCAECREKLADTLIRETPTP
jgi:hypothetical protein